MGNIWRRFKLSGNIHYLDLQLYLIQNSKIIYSPVPIHHQSNGVVGWYTRYEFDDLVDVNESFFRDGRFQLCIIGEDSELMETRLEKLEEILFGLKGKPQKL